MSHQATLARKLRPALLAGLALGLLGPGCRRAVDYEARRAKVAAGEAKKETPETKLSEDITWQAVTGTLAEDMPIEFVTEKDSEWPKLPGYWTDPAVKAAAMIGLPGLPTVVPGALPSNAIKIKVPLGLPDPAAYIPAGNPPTRRKWQLGRKLFFDEKILTANRNESCATCHVPNLGYTDGKKVATLDGFNVPTLINVVYNTSQFGDGRVTYLEEVVQAKLEDEGARTRPFRHVWSGVIARLRKDAQYGEEFEAVFRTHPTQDAVGKAIATYLRTILAGNSVQDRAEQKRRQAKAGRLSADHYKSALTPVDLKVLGRAGAEPGLVALDLLRGQELFLGKGACASCHSLSSPQYSDNDFHNIGVAPETFAPTNLHPTGRFVHAPIGLKSRFLWGAYRTPTLRSLVRTSPYLHNGQAEDLPGVVRFHVRAPEGGGLNRYLSPKLSNDDGSHKNFGLRENDIQALVLFLRGLNGDDVDPSIKARP